MTILTNTEQCDHDQHAYQNPYDCIIFYRWFTITQDGQQHSDRGLVMARAVADTLSRSFGITVWLDQYQMSRDATREQVLSGIHKAFQGVRYVIILAAPGDWDRFVNDDDIHRWEWEISLKSGKPVWVLQYDTKICPPNTASRSGGGGLLLRQLSLVHELLLFSNRLAELAFERKLEVRNLTAENFYTTLEEIAQIQMLVSV
ncbi:hypothetical protein F5880DRAFT_575039 [Lentinula raphanica]|nr:hypothetical protein F5880DRAFT_575039 [Lentinula raphanica]